MNYIDVRSDTVTEPTKAMRDAMYIAKVGDDVYEDDPSVKELELLAATITGKEAALFVPSGTFGNQLALFTHCKRGSEVILSDNSHIVVHEVGAASVIAGVQLRTIDSIDGIISPADVLKRIRKGNDIHFPETSLICMENAHSNGRVIPLSNMSEIYSIAKEYNLPVHLDGARLFNASTYLNKDPKEITKYCDSVMFCLSKGLCAPVGSILAGDKDFIRKARKNRKLMGGGLRQSGFLAAAGIVALNDMVQNLKYDHENAKLLAQELSKIPQIKINLKDVHINMVFFEIDLDDNKSEEIVGFFYENGIKINPPEDGEMRFVTNYWVDKNDIEKIVSTLKSFINRHR
ncbi:low-specificity L-threonine aldolase [Clostridium algidicarnis]|uniref:low-specificity L-threonine aldolase n=1 Tax=Clostridium algidicarnis TaxID=37659 RepID=UPI001627D248|nr:low-specificity L-threonine aldolase [Clostridium algidicarnis]MBB6631587.1 low-specificity L-threonine aldolase [Clostridium algidicarnis]MCB2285998.1 low-specificity L-threonine aldolase [Clostridium algidicarnis]